MNQLHQKFVMTRRIRVLSQNIASTLPEGKLTILDVGAGSGEIAREIISLRPELEITGVDVLIRPNTAIPISHFDGTHLPQPDNSVDFVIIVDVLHHCDDPKQLLSECLRVSRKGVLIKDHVQESLLDRWTLSFMDWVGNRSHGVRLTYRYQTRHQWLSLFAEIKAELAREITSLHLYPQPFSLLFDRSLQAIFLLQPKASS